jgi:tetratricopeptide (TPR) repeat protein
VSKQAEERPSEAVNKKPAAAEKTVTADKPAATEKAAATETESDDDARQKVAVERFLVVLEKTPRRGTALDKVYGFHVERGTLDELLKTLREKGTDEKLAVDESGKAWMILGLMESLRGQDALAVQALEKAEAKLADNPLVSFYLGQAFVLVGRTDQAVLALERAIERKPVQGDMLDVFQALGRVHQRAQRNEQALAVWTRLEKLFPNDSRVQEQIATTLLEEGDHAAALPRFESLVKATKDPYRKSLFQMEAAEIKVRLGQGESAIADFEKLLGQLNPENWLYREVRRKLEQVFLRTEDQAGLVKYYETWLQKGLSLASRCSSFG